MDPAAGTIQTEIRGVVTNPSPSPAVGLVLSMYRFEAL